MKTKKHMGKTVLIYDTIIVIPLFLKMNQVITLFLAIKK